MVLILYNDSYNSGIFVNLFKDKIKWCRELGGFFVYNGKYWECDRNGFIMHYAIKVYEKLQADLTAYPINCQTDEDNAELFARHVKATGNESKLSALLELAKPYLSQLPETFDSNPNYFNCNTHTVDLFTRQVYSFSSEDLITKTTKVDFIPSAQCPAWLKFIDDIFLGREEIKDFMQRYVGYSLTTSTKEQCMCILYGAGRNGKGVFTEVIRRVLGDYAKVCPSNVLIAKRDENFIPNDIAALRGARLITINETNENVTLDEACIKKFTSADMMKARFLYKEGFEFIPTFKILFSSNHKPNIRGTDYGIWRRIRLVPFEMTVTDKNDDKELFSKLLNELPGIFNWVIEGYKKWSKTGLPTPPIIMQSTEEYKYEEDTLGQFIEDECVICENEYVGCREFKERVHHYNKFISQKVISDHMRRKGFLPKDNRRYLNDGTQIRAYFGIRLKNKFESNNIMPGSYEHAKW